MADSRRWGADDDSRLRELHEQGDVSLRRAATELGWSIETVVRHAKRLGLDWSRGETEAAAEARRADGRRRRSALAAGLLEDAERLRGELWAPTTVFNFGGRDNIYAEMELPEPTHADKLKILQAIGVAGQTVERFEKMDSDSGVVEAVGMVDQIWQAIKAAAATPAALEAAGVEGTELL